MAPRIWAAAPTSTPQVGCETMKSLGPASISRPTMNFCRLPPDSERAAAPGPFAFTLKALITRDACCASWCTRIQPPAKPGAEIDSVRVSSMLCARLSVGTAPRPSRSSGTKCRPRARRAPGFSADTSTDPMATLPLGARTSSPERAYKSSFCPLPDTPATPTTSPACTVSEIPFKSTPNWSSRARLRPRTCKTGAPGCCGRCSSCGGSAPIISRESEALDSSAGLHTPVTLPPRNTVQALHSSRISWSLCEIYKMLQPSAASFLSTTNSFSTAWGVSTEVGSSRMRSCGLVSSARMISTRCISPTLRVCTGRSGSISRPYSAALVVMRWLTCARLSVLSSPSQTFSATVMVSNKLKCWNTMLMPRARAS